MERNIVIPAKLVLTKAGSGMQNLLKTLDSASRFACAE